MKRRKFLGSLAAGLGSTLLAPEHLGALTPSAALPPSPRIGLPTDDRFIERWSWAMGQPVHLQLFASSDNEGYAAAEEALAELRLVEQHLSLFSDASDLSELNRRAGGKGTRVGPDLQRVLERSLQLERLTQGAFNPAVEPLMRLWGFRAPRVTEPTIGELAEARESVRAARILLTGDYVSLPVRHTELDLGGIGVGYGLDRAISRLRARGIQSAFLDVSGDCFALGAPPGQDGWLVDIASPRSGVGPVASTRLHNAALATSANTVSVVRYGRAARGHVMNPESGWPADALVQVSVVARTGIDADALSTAMLVSGKPCRGVLRYYPV
jgi:FAD:protein FMN transferase